MGYHAKDPVLEGTYSSYGTRNRQDLKKRYPHSMAILRMADRACGTSRCSLIEVCGQWLASLLYVLS